jgi:acetyl esterase/lipase
MPDLMDRLDPELVEPLNGIMAATGGGFNLRDIPATRAMVNAMVAAVKAEVPPNTGVEAKDYLAPLGESGEQVPVRIYRPTKTADADADRELPALIWMHAGGYVIGNIELDDLMAGQLSSDVGCAVVSVDYRLAPEHPYPAALEDCYAVLQWLSSNAADLGILRSKIGVGGASAGGGLAAGLALLARDKNGPALTHQLLIYPAINDRNTEQTSATVPENLFWSRESALIGWQAYLSGNAGGDAVSEYAAAYRAEGLAGLPPTFLAVGSVDMFVSDVTGYADRLIQAGVATEMHIYPGAFHAFDSFAPTARVSKQFVSDRNSALRRALAAE